MAIEEITFTTVTGEEINISNLVNQMINYYDLKLEVGETRITDFAVGSEIRNLLESFAICEYARLDEEHDVTSIAFISTAEDFWLDRIGELPFIDLKRKEGDYATGEVTFTLATVQDEDYTIPEDTIVTSSETGLSFVTSGECIISAGELSENANVDAELMGADYNLGSHSIDTIDDENVDTELVSVDNQNPLENGSDDEEDDEYRQRLLDNVQADGFGTIGWYEHLCSVVDGVHDVLMINSNDYTKTVLVNGRKKPTPDTVLLEVLTELTNVGNKVLNHNFMVAKPTYTNVDLVISLDVTTEISVDDLEFYIYGFFDGLNARQYFEGVNINQSVSKTNLESVFALFDNVVRVTSIQQNGEEVTTLEPDNNGVLRLNSVTFNQTEV